MRRLRKVYDRLGALLAYVKDEKGQTLVEYILVIVVMTLAIFTAYNAVAFNTTIEATMSNVNQKLNAP
jgi:Flp pilus assembly pilin Flp